MLKLEPGKLYAMPACFGPLQAGLTTYEDVRTIALTWKTDRAALEALIPEVFELTEPVLHLGYTMNGDCEWLAGGSYNLLGLSAPVVFKGKAGPMSGFYSLLMWENRTDPILPGRERTGIPKIHAEIQDLRRVGKRWYGAMSSNGHGFFELEFNENEGGERRAAKPDEWNRINWFGWRYIPTVNGTGGSINEFVNFPQETLTKETRPGVARIKWNALGWRQAPAQVHILRRIAELPVLDCVNARYVRTTNRLRSDLSVVVQPELDWG